LNTHIYSRTLAPPDGWSGALQSAVWYWLLFRCFYLLFL